MGGARAECAWGEGPDVLVIVESANASGYPWVEYEHDVPGSLGSFGLTAPEALALAARLVQAAVEATRLDAGYAEAGRPKVQ